jgi:predicted DNA-binding transcriptional regulator AlpA
MAKKLTPNQAIKIKKLQQKINLIMKKEFSNILLEAGTPTFRQENGLISKKEVLIYFGIGESTLRKWRDYCGFPEGIMIGREICFLLSEVKKFKRP